jgi:hypothetical protein
MLCKEVWTCDLMSAAYGGVHRLPQQFDDLLARVLNVSDNTWRDLGHSGAARPSTLIAATILQPASVWLTSLVTRQACTSVQAC